MKQDAFLARWVQFFLTKYKSTLLIILAIIIAGTWGTVNNQRQDFPSISSNFILVQAIYPGAATEDVEQDVIIPIEQAITDLDGIKFLRSTSAANFGTVVLELEEIDGAEEAANEAEELVSKAKLPTDVETSVELIDVVGPSSVYALTSDSASKKDLLAQADSVKNILLDSTSDISRIDVLPENEFVVRVHLDAEKLSDEGIQGQAVAEILRSSLVTLPGGSINTDDGERLTIKINPATGSLKQLKEIEIDGVPLDDLAEISREPKNQDIMTLTGFINDDGDPVSQDSVYLYVYKKDDGDVLRIAAALEEAQNQIAEDELLPKGIDLALVFDNSDYVEKQINDLLRNGALGLVLILLVLMLFINFRTGLAVAIIIPLTFMGTLAVLYAIGYSINTMTLFGMLLVLGILVDNAIVIAEGVTHAIENGEKKSRAVISTIHNLGPAVTAATATTIVAFIPFASIGGIIGEFMRYIPVTIIIMLVISYLLAITVMPLAAKILFKEETKAERRAKKLKSWQMIAVVPALIYFGQRMVDWLEDLYTKKVEWMHRKLWRKLATVAITLVLIGGSIVNFASQLDVEEFPIDDSNLLTVALTYPQNMDFDNRVDALSRLMDKVVMTPYFVSYYSYDGQMFVVFNNPKDRESDNDINKLNQDLLALTENVRADLSKDGITFSSRPLGYGPPTDGYDIVMEIRGDNLKDLASVSENLKDYIETIDGVEEVAISAEDNAVEGVAVDLLDEEIRDKGIDPFVANATVNSVFSEQVVGSMVINDNGLSEDVVIDYSQDSKKSIDNVREIVVGASGFPPSEVTLDDIANVEKRDSLSKISHLDQKRVASIQVKVADEFDSVAIDNQIRAELSGFLNEYNIDPDEVIYGGYEASANDSFANLQIVFILAMIAVYLILVYQFNSFIQPGLIMSTVPLALIGVFPGLLAVGSSINMVSGLGIIALVGIVVNDAIVFVDYMNRLQRNNPDWPMKKVVVETGRARFKPILSTSITTIFGILPLTITDPFWRGLGTALITGLACSTLGTLIVFPILLSWADKFLHIGRGRRKKKTSIETVKAEV